MNNSLGAWSATLGTSARRSSQCAGCGTTDPPLHELSDGIFACDRCIEATLAVVPKNPRATEDKGSDLDCNSD